MPGQWDLIACHQFAAVLMQAAYAFPHYVDAWAALTDAGTTTVVYMARRTFPDLAAKLIANGLAPETPALIAEGVSTEAENIRRFTVASLAAYLAETPAPERAPSLIIYGPLMT